MTKTRVALSAVIVLAMTGLSAVLLTGATPSGAVIDFSLPGKVYIVGATQTPLGSLQPLRNDGVQVVPEAARVPASLPSGTLLIFNGCPGTLTGKTKGWIAESVGIIGVDCGAPAFVAQTNAIQLYARAGAQADVAGGLVSRAAAPAFANSLAATVGPQFASVPVHSWVGFRLGHTGASAWYEILNGSSVQSLQSSIRGGDFFPRVR